MTKFNNRQMECLNCKKNSTIVMWDSVNVYLNPELKQDLMDSKLFQFTCPFCKFPAKLEYPLLYHDQANKFMIYMSITEDNENNVLKITKEAQGFYQHLLNYRLRIVRTYNQLKEKILIFDHKLDDRAIELLKRFFWISYIEDKGGSYEKLYFADANIEDGIPSIELVFFPPEKEAVSFKLSGKNGYPRALDILHNDFKVSKKEEISWRIVDFSYWDLAKSGRG